MKNILLISFFGLFILSCNLEETPKANVSKEPIFNTEEGLKLYTNSFYNYLPSDTRRFSSLSYYNARQGAPDFLRPGGYDENSASSWSWTQLRNINYFIENCNSEAVPEEVRNNYLGIARFFRAYFYFGKMKQYGDLPWIDHPLDVEDPLLTASQDDRTLIADKIKEDLDFAIANIINKKDESSSTITSTVAAAFKSRVCLWEGTFRKYHKNAGLQSSADDWLQEAVSAAEFVMNAGYSIYMGAGPENSYRELFLAKTPIASEVLYATTFDRGLGVIHSGNHCWTSVTYCGATGLTRSFIKTYLMRDGTPFTDQEGAHAMGFVEEMENRDYRLSQTVITPGFTRLESGQEVETATDYGLVLTGYQTIKFTLDDKSLDNVNENENNAIIFRYAEVLLNYAEAKAELGTLTDEDWSKTIGVLRERGGITGGLNNVPTEVDTYMQERFFPDISDPAILEIRRERGIELALEGTDWEDAQRWKAGELLTDPWDGLYIPELDVPYDMNGDGKPDVMFTKDLDPDKISGVYNFYVGEKLSNGATNKYQLAEDGHTILFAEDETRIWEDHMYFYPVALTDILKNPNLKQNPGW